MGSGTHTGSGSGTTGKNDSISPSFFLVPEPVCVPDLLFPLFSSDFLKFSLGK
jgi:hypothetical protein